MILSNKFKYQLFLLYANVNFILMSIKWEKKTQYITFNIYSRNCRFCICSVVIVKHSIEAIASLMTFLSRIYTFISIIYY